VLPCRILGDEPDWTVLLSVVPDNLELCCRLSFTLHAPKEETRAARLVTARLGAQTG
jgi:hypothetical protein